MTRAVQPRSNVTELMALKLLHFNTRALTPDVIAESLATQAVIRESLWAKLATQLRLQGDATVTPVTPLKT